MTWPETNPASSLVRNEIVAAMSAGWPTRPTGIWAEAPAMKSSKLTFIRYAVCRVMSVAMKPGATALAVTLNRPSSIASVFVNPCSPALAAE